MTHPHDPDASGWDTATTGPHPASAPAAPGTSTALGAAAVWRRARGFLLAFGMLIATGVALAAFNSGENRGALDPRSADPSGSRAVAELLKERGVTTRVVTRTQDAADAAGPGTTLLVTDPDLLAPRQLSALKASIDLSGGRTVLVSPGRTSLATLAPGVQTRPSASDELRAPSCALPAARTAGSAETGSQYGYRTGDPKATACYPDDGHATLLLLPAPAGGDTVLLGSGRILQNEALASEGNASLALQTLGSHPGSSGTCPPRRGRRVRRRGRGQEPLRPHPGRLVLGPAPALPRRHPRRPVARPPTGSPRHREAPRRHPRLRGHRGTRPPVPQGRRPRPRRHRAARRHPRTPGRTGRRTAHPGPRARGPGPGRLRPPLRRAPGRDRTPLRHHPLRRRGTRRARRPPRRPRREVRTS
ncbi:DUF4350 domain-containing protein [Streptomyces sp. MS1.HAVA.3]|uniref:DUF4350 domain-containing protein n=1 Tax=Streptomyces caledonius TaxID=3134107 RepID=A0ABU8U974_9ACTN